MHADTPTIISDRDSLERRSASLSGETEFGGRCFQLGERIYWGDVLAGYDGRFLKRHGISHVLSLTTPEAISNNLPAEFLLLRDELTVARVSKPIPLHGERESAIAAAAAELNRLVTAGNSVYVHCIRGEDRTPLTIRAAIRNHALPIAIREKISADNQPALPRIPRLAGPGRPNQNELVLLSGNAGLQRVFSGILAHDGLNVNIRMPDQLSEILSMPNTLVCIDCLNLFKRRTAERQAINAGDFGSALSLVPHLLERGHPVFLFSALALGSEIGADSRYYVDLGTDTSIVEVMRQRLTGVYDYEEASAAYERVRKALVERFPRLTAKFSLGHDH